MDVPDDVWGGLMEWMRPAYRDDATLSHVQACLRSVSRGMRDIVDRWAGVYLRTAHVVLRTPHNVSPYFMTTWEWARRLVKRTLKLRPHKLRIVLEEQPARSRNTAHVLAGALRNLGTELAREDAELPALTLVRYVPLTEDVMRALANLRGLRELTLDRMTTWPDEGVLEFIGELSCLTRLDITSRYGRQLNTRTVEHIASCLTSLRELRVPGIPSALLMDGSVLERLSQLTHLGVVVVAHGSVARAWSETIVSRLREVYLKVDGQGNCIPALRGLLDVLQQHPETRVVITALFPSDAVITMLAGSMAVQELVISTLYLMRDIQGGGWALDTLRVVGEASTYDEAASLYIAGTIPPECTVVLAEHRGASSIQSIANIPRDRLGVLKNVRTCPLVGVGEAMLMGDELLGVAINHKDTTDPMTTSVLSRLAVAGVPTWFTGLSDPRGTDITRNPPWLPLITRVIVRGDADADVLLNRSVRGTLSMTLKFIDCHEISAGRVALLGDAYRKRAQMRVHNVPLYRIIEMREACIDKAVCPDSVAVVLDA